jgi:hypothetical protein
MAAFAVLQGLRFDTAFLRPADDSEINAVSIAGFEVGRRAAAAARDVELQENVGRR